MSRLESNKLTVDEIIANKGVIRQLDTLADLQALTSHPDKVLVSGYHTKGDGAFGSNIHEWDATSTEEPIGGVIVKPDNVTGAGRYKLKFSGAISANYFGNDDSALKNCFDYANPSGIKVIGTGLFNLIGSSIVEIQTDCDFSGAVFDINGWSGQFHINRTKASSTYTSGDSIFDLFTTSATLQKGSSYIDTLDLDATLNNTYINVNTSNNFYTYRGVEQYQNELNVIQNRGTMLSPILFDLSNITNIVSFPIEDKTTTIKNFNFIETNKSNLLSGTLFKVTSSLVSLENLVFKVVGTQIFNGQRISIQDSYNIKVKNVIGLPIDNSDGSYGYILNSKNSYDVTADYIVSEGYGWGATGNNNNRKMEYKNCILSRVDYHNPIYEYLKIDNCIIGKSALQLSVIGDTYIKNTSFVIKPQYVGGRPSLINARNDAGGGILDGNLYLDNVTIAGNDTALDAANFWHDSYYLVYKSYTSNYYSDVISVGSPISNVMFHNIYIKGLKFDDKNITLYPFSFSFDTVQHYRSPKSILIENMEVGKIEFNFSPTRLDEPYFDVVDSSSFSSIDYNMSISISNSIFNEFKSSSNSTLYNAIFKIDNVNGIADTNPYIEHIQNGKMSISNSVLSSVRISGNNGFIFSSIDSCHILPSATYDANDPTTWGVKTTNYNRNRMRISNSIIDVTEREQELNLALCNLTSTTLRNGEDSHSEIQINHADLSTSLDVQMIRGNKYVVTSGYTSDSTSSEYVVVFSDVGNPIIIQTRNGKIICDPTLTDLGILTESTDTFRNIKLLTD